MAEQARSGRVLWFFLVAWLCSILLGAAVAYRVEARNSTLRNLERSGQLATMSDRQVADETRKAERISQVGKVALGVVKTPLQLGGACVAILALGWFFRGRVRGAAVAPVAAATLLPGAIADVVDAVTAFRYAALPPEGVPLAPRTLSAIFAAAGHPPAGALFKLGNALDFFSLWSAVMLAFGLAAAGRLPKRTALIGTLVAWTCYRLLSQVAAGG